MDEGGWEVGREGGGGARTFHTMHFKVRREKGAEGGGEGGG
jgi:hypothetical protein